jgi:hypothetical protein
MKDPIGWRETVVQLNGSIGTGLHFGDESLECRHHFIQYRPGLELAAECDASFVAVLFHASSNLWTRKYIVKRNMVSKSVENNNNNNNNNNKLLLHTLSQYTKSADLDSVGPDSLASISVKATCMRVSISTGMSRLRAGYLRACVCMLFRCCLYPYVKRQLLVCELFLSV